jgi:sugar O-acyltransferase (sialic acid O-acetyltransferase NeuD family)
LISNDQILLVGGGGHCKSVIEAIESEGKYNISGIIDAPEKVGQTVLGYPIIGTDSDLPQLVSKVGNVIITVGQLKNAAVRIRIFEQLKELGANLPVIIAATARVSKHASLGEGTVVLHNALVNAGAEVGANTIINTGAVIEHDVRIGNHCHISTGALVNGDCEIGNQVLIGSGAVLKQGIKIAGNAVVGAGAVVLQNVNNAEVVVGNPAKEKLRNE